MLNQFITRNAQSHVGGNGLNPNQIMQVHPQAVTPQNPGDMREVRTCKIEPTYRPVTKEEANQARVAAAQAQHQAQVDQKYYAALAKHERADAKSQTAYRKYQAAQAGATFQKTTANAQLGKTLYNLAPQYAKTHMTLGAAGQEAAVKFAEYQALYQGQRH